MITEFNPDRQKKNTGKQNTAGSAFKPRDLEKEAKRLMLESENINYDSVAKMLCGQELTEDEKKDVEKYNELQRKLEDLGNYK